MRVALMTTFSASKKEPLAALLERIHAAFPASGQGEPTVTFLFSDAPVPGGVSSVERVLKRFTELERFATTAVALLANPPIRQLTNRPASPAAGEPVPFATLLAIAAGVPKSFPFHSMVIQFHSAAFGEAVQHKQIPGGGVAPGVTVTDSWWVSGRQRSLFALTVVDADVTDQKLPSPPEAVAAVLGACGKAKGTVQLPFSSPSEDTTAAAGPNPELLRAIAAVMRDYRARLSEIIERAALPHDLPPALEARTTTPLSATTGPKKPALVHAFKPLGYTCRAESGTFTLRRRTSNNLTVEINLDVGTWSRSLTAGYAVQGLGSTARLPLPVSARAGGGGQYPIGDAERWQQIVDNLAAMVAEYDRSFVPDVDRTAGPTPEWYKPES